jgi:hypothetical protein
VGFVRDALELAIVASFCYGEGGDIFGWMMQAVRRAVLDAFEFATVDS